MRSSLASEDVGPETKLGSGCFNYEEGKVAYRSMNSMDKVNLKAELEMLSLHEKIDELRETRCAG